MTAAAMAKATTTAETAARFHPAGLDFSNYKPKHFLWSVDGKVATITLEPAGAEESADARILCRVARHCSATCNYADGIKTS